MASRLFSVGLNLIAFLFILYVAFRPHSGDVTIKANEYSPDLLVSEVQAAPDRTALVGCFVVIENHDSIPRKVILQSTGCSCYGFVEDDIPIEVGEELTLSPGQKRTLRFHAVPPDSAKEETLHAAFSIVERDGKKKTETVTGKVRVFADVSVIPRAITVEVAPAAGKHEVRDVHLEFITRAEKNKPFILEPDEWPAWVTLQAEPINGPASQVGHDAYQNLWQFTWPIKVSIDVTPETPRRADPWHLPLLVKDHAGKTVARTDLLLSLYAPLPIAFPSKIDFGNVTIGTGRPRRILLASTNDKPFSMAVQDEGKPDFLEVTIAPDPATQHWLELRAVPISPGPFQGSLKLKTDLAEMSEITIEVVGTAIME